MYIIYYESRLLLKNKHTLSSAIFNQSSKSIPIQSERKKNPITGFSTERLKSFLPVVRHVG